MKTEQEIRERIEQLELNVKKLSEDIRQGFFINDLRVKLDCAREENKILRWVLGEGKE